jgi:hypothetical protein
MEKFTLNHVNPPNQYCGFSRSPRKGWANRRTRGRGNNTLRARPRDLAYALSDMSAIRNVTTRMTNIGIYRHFSRFTNHCQNGVSHSRILNTEKHRGRQQMGATSSSHVPRKEETQIRHTGTPQPLHHERKLRQDHPTECSLRWISWLREKIHRHKPNGSYHRIRCSRE